MELKDLTNDQIRDLINSRYGLTSVHGELINEKFKEILMEELERRILQGKGIKQPTGILGGNENVHK